MSDAFQVLKIYLAANPPAAVGSILGRQESYAAHLWARAACGADPDVQWLLQRFPHSMSRNDIINIPNAAPEVRAAVQDRRVFIASLMWGYGTSIGRRGVLKYISPVLADSQLPTSLAICRAKIGVDLAGAYEALTWMVGVKSAFFTKYLYFLGRITGAVRCPLILDTNVADSLAVLTGFGLSVSCSRWPQSDAKAYEWYVCLVQSWSSSIGCAAEVIEYSLYSPRRSSIEPIARAYYQASLP